METAHFLLTRFNVPLGSVPVDLGLNDDWLEHRFALFENFCLPSVLAQQSRDFSWFIWIDQRTPDRWRARLQTDLDPLPSATVLPVKTGSDGFWRADMERLAAQSGAGRIVTTRLDNDDAISRDYVAAIARRAARLPRHDRHYVINFRHGCQVGQAGFFAVSERLNPFLSVVSPRHPLITAWHGEHASMNRFGTVIDSGIFSGRSPYWLQSIHPNNVANRLQPKRARLDPRRLARFSLGQNWMRLLQNEKFVPAKAEVLRVQFPYRLPRLGRGQSQDPVCEIAMSGFKGESLFESVRREMAFHKSDLLQFIGFLLQDAPPGLIIDAGANIGNAALFFAKVLGADVLCVEPNPAALSLLKSNIALNGVTGQVSIVEAAVSDRRGAAHLRAGSLLNLGATSVVPDDRGETGSIVMMPLDEIVANSGRRGKVSLIMLAVEGFENRALRGALQIIRNDRPILVVDAATAGAPQEIRETLRPFHYAQAGPFCETAYVFGPSRWQLWRAMFRRRMFRMGSRLKRKLFKT